jgi:outer membrane protein assembly factor BamB
VRHSPTVSKSCAHPLDSLVGVCEKQGAISGEDTMADHGVREGQQLGNYRLVRLVGQGGFADVYLGEHVYLGTQAAIKVLHTQLVGSDIERFRQEARIIAHLEHPHIVRVLDFGVQESTPFLVMTYAPNGTLRQRHPRGSRVPLALASFYVKQMASALQYAHGQHLIHRDIKPENMLLGHNNEVLLSDFGIALVEQSSRQQSIQENIASTIAYMAPEQIAAHPRLSSDQYSLGVVVYEWLSGRRPFEGSLTEVVFKQSSEPPPSLREQVAGLSDAVETVVFIALAKDPKQRFASMQAFATAFEQACQIPVSESITPVLPQGGIPVELLTPSNSSNAALASLPPERATSLAATETGPNRLPSTTPASITPPTMVSVTPPTTISPSRPGRAGLSRRSLLLGLAGVVGIGLVGGTLIWLTRLSTPQTSLPLPRSTPPAIIPVKPYAVNYAVFGYDAQHTHFNPYEKQLSPVNVSRLVRAWIAPTGASITSSPVIAGGIVYIGSNDGRLYAFNSTTGKTVWTVPTGGPIFSSPSVADGVVYSGSNDTKVYAFNATTGKQLWVTPTGDQIYSSPVVANGVVYIGSWDHKVYALDSGTGAILWATSTGDAVSSSPAFANGVVYIGSQDHKLYALNASTGSIMWSASTGGGIFSSPAVANGVVYVGSQDGKVYAFAADTGNVLWTASTEDRIYSSPSVTGGVVYIGSQDSKLYALFASTGKALWVTNIRYYILSSPTVANEVIYIGAWDGRLYALDARTGKVLLGLVTKDHIFSTPDVYNGTVYVGTWSGGVYAFRLPAAKKL